MFKRKLYILFAFIPQVLFGQYEIIPADTTGCDSAIVSYSLNTNAGVVTIQWDFYWAVGPVLTSNELAPTGVRYDTSGSYLVGAIINGIDYFRYVNIVVNESPDATFSASDTLTPGDLYMSFLHTGTIDPAETNTYSWDFGDGNSSTTPHPLHQYADAGPFAASLTIYDGMCTGSFSTPVAPNEYAGPPYTFLASDTVGCGAVSTIFTLYNFSGVDTISSYMWIFGNGDTSYVENPDTVIYRNSGTYTVKLFLDGDTLNPVVKTDYIVVNRVIPALFTEADTNTDGQFIKIFRHYPYPLESGLEYGFNWTFYDTLNNVIFTDTDRESLVIFPQEGVYVASFEVTDSNGCRDLQTKRVTVNPELVIQNYFTPNNDGRNDEFRITGNGNILLSLHVYSRTGLLIYMKESRTISWDGKNASGVEMPPGIYYYTLESLDGDPGNKFTKAGFVYLFRNTVLPLGE